MISGAGCNADGKVEIEILGKPERVKSELESAPERSLSLHLKEALLWMHVAAIWAMSASRMS